MGYVAPLPAYKFFEPKRTTPKEWTKMAADAGANWSLLPSSEN